MIIFDFNGTMVFDAPYHYLAWTKISKEIRGYPMSVKELNDSCHGKVNQEIIAYLDDRLNYEEREALSKRKEALYRELASGDKDYHLVDGLEKFLNYLKEHQFKMNIASASIKDNIDFFIDYFNLKEWFETDKIKYDDGKYEDKKAMYIDAAQAFDEDIRNCIIFEDSTSGVKCAQAISAKMIIVICEEKREREFRELGIDFFIRDFNDQRIYQLIEGIK